MKDPARRKVGKTRRATRILDCVRLSGDETGYLGEPGVQSPEGGDPQRTRPRGARRQHNVPEE